jgi:outer membrane protein TolC
LQQLILFIVQEVARAIQDIETLSEEVEVTRTSTALARAQLAAEQEKFRLGLTTSFNVPELREDLSSARTSETQASGRIYFLGLDRSHSRMSSKCKLQ